MIKYYHLSDGKVYGGEITDLDTYKDKLRNTYGSLRGILICNAKNIIEAESKLLYRYKTWDGKKWLQPKPLID